MLASDNTTVGLASGEDEPWPLAVNTGSSSVKPGLSDVEAPSIPQVGCFDTAFHRTLPPVARLVPLPRRVGIQRFGVDGLPFESVLERLRSLGVQQADGRAIIAHLGSDASTAAVAGGRCLEATTCLTSAGGLVMGPRPADLNPGILVHLAQRGMTPAELQRPMVATHTNDRVSATKGRSARREP